MGKVPASVLFTLATLVLVILAASVPANAQTFTVLYNLGSKPGDPIDGGTTPNVVAQGRDGNLYTTSYWGGTTNQGTVYKVTPAGTLTVLYSFDGTHGANPWSGLILATDGNFYGTTSSGGASSNGTIFKITPSGTFTVLYNFTGGSDGGIPYAPPTQGIDGNLYGTARTGGAGYGTIYRLSPSGTFTVLHRFAGSDGSTPAANLIQATDGNFYGTTSAGGNGTCNCGTVFKMKPNGTLTVLYSFDDTHGNAPIYAALVQASNGKFYGTTFYGGANGVGVIYEITSAGMLTVLHDFATTDGQHPIVALVQATDKNLYSITVGGGATGYGTIFRISPSGGPVGVRYDFNVADGNPSSPLRQNTNGILYGKTDNGGTKGDGEFYSLSEGLAPFITFLPQQSLGKVGATIGMLGQGFTSSSVVQFGGVQAASVKLSGTTFLTAKVPAGALTGSVTVTTGATTLTSNQKFRVKPQLLSFSPPSGAVGTQVTITGVSFTQTMGVGFGDNMPAEFTVNSDTEITATVPAGAKTGPIGVVTKGGTAISSATFTVN